MYGQHINGLLLDGVAHGQQLFDGGRFVALGANHSANGLLISVGEEALDTLDSLA